MSTFTNKQLQQLAAAIGKYACTTKNPCGVIFGRKNGQYFIADDQVSQLCNTFEDLVEAAVDWYDDLATDDATSDDHELDDLSYE